MVSATPDCCDQDCEQHICVPYKDVNHATDDDNWLEVLGDNTNMKRSCQSRKAHAQSPSDNDGESDTDQPQLISLPNPSTRLTTITVPHARNKFTPQTFIIKFDGQHATFHPRDIVSNPCIITIETLKYDEFCKEVEKQLQITLTGKHVFANGLDGYEACRGGGGEARESAGLVPADDGKQWRAALQMYHDVGAKRCDFLVLEDIDRMKKKGGKWLWCGLLAMVIGFGVGWGGVVLEREIRRVQEMKL
ncbi:hypothetical protein T440DRAFT_519538 [Plenodomus tracheiphilus IPT5]|uniref:Uncharacterized protein n=1 Tax=Plenodomus tracheiphilus IPT5 TaxID=1408161 RepID=A0A6A7B2S5_9PLEO|nr:hypothetical protein T440DRAFT_519538 [Plenodomus tracheiphilus IPT5]